MIKISELPTNPIDAFQVMLDALNQAAASFPEGGALNIDLKAQSTSGARILEALHTRLPNFSDYGNLFTQLLSNISGNSPSQAKKTLASIEQVFLANSFEAHFIDQEQEELLNTLDWAAEDRQAVLGALSEARRFVSFASSLDDRQKGRANYWISKAENEVFATKGKWAQIRSAMSEVGDIANELGEKARPLAKLVEIVRTTTKKNITEVRQIAAEEPPKQIAAPSTDD